MSSSASGVPVVRRPQRSERGEAWHWALEALPAEMRNVVAESSPVVADQPEGLFGAWRGAQLVGVVWGEMQAGHAAVAFLPQTAEDEPLATAVLLLAQLESHFVQRGARFYQIQREGVAAREASLLEAAGLRHAGDLLYLACDPSDVRAATPPREELEFEPYREEHQARLAAIVEHTYTDSLDLPALDGVRSLDDVVAGYRQTGAYRPEFWWIVRRATGDVGCLLLTEHSQRQWELIYMGVIPAARGHGIGGAIVRHAQRAVAQAGGCRLLLGVDAANCPALKTYARTGFTPVRKTSVFLKVLRPHQPKAHDF